MDFVKVLHIINGEYYSGAERVQDLLAESLPGYGFSVDFALLKPDLFEKKFSSKNEASVYNFPMRSRFDFRKADEISKLIHQNNYQIIHTHTPRAAIIGKRCAQMTRRPMVHHIHSPAAADSENRLQNVINAYMERKSLNLVGKIITVSKSLEDHMCARGFSKNRIRIVRNGVRIKSTLPPRVAPTTPYTIGVIALFRPRKGLEVLLKAVSTLKRQNPSLKLRAIGAFESIDYRNEIDQLVEQLNLAENIEWTGFSNDVDNELYKMDALVLPSLFGEGLPMVVLEAMASGIPVVATAVEGVPEAITHMKEGVIVSPNDVSSLAQGIETLLNSVDLWNTLRVNAFNRQQMEFSDKSMAKGVADVYMEVLNHGKKGKTVQYEHRRTSDARSG